MKANVGAIDKAVRIVVGIALLSLLVLLEGPARWLGLIGLVPLATGLFGFCPMYALFGRSTCGSGKKQAPGASGASAKG